MRVILPLSTVVSICISSGAAQADPFDELVPRATAQPPSDSSIVPVIAARISVSDQRVRCGEKIEVSVGITNESDHEVTVFNPFLVGLAGRQPVILAVFDANGRYRGDLIPIGAGSQVSYFEVFFETLPAAAICGTKIAVHMNFPPGTYTVQAIYRDFFISNDPVSSDAGLAALQKNGADRREIERYRTQLRETWWRKYSGREIFRSNAVRIIVVDPNESPDLARFADWMNGRSAR